MRGEVGQPLRQKIDVLVDAREIGRFYGFYNPGDFGGFFLGDLFDLSNFSGSCFFGSGGLGGLGRLVLYGCFDD